MIDFGGVLMFYDKNNSSQSLGALLAAILGVISLGVGLYLIITLRSNVLFILSIEMYLEIIGFIFAYMLFAITHAGDLDGKKAFVWGWVIAFFVVSIIIIFVVSFIFLIGAI